MAQCQWCDKRGFFLSVDSNGLCRQCQPIIIEVESRARVLNDSLRLAQTGKTFKTRLSRCELAIEHAEFLKQFESKGVPTTSPPPSEIIRICQEERITIVVEEANREAEKAREKASVAASSKVKERTLTSAILKVREIAKMLDDSDTLDTLENQLRRDAHRVTLDGFLEAARKAEFKGNVKKALDQYKEALFFLKSDDIPDNFQQTEIQEIEAKISELRSAGW